MRRIVSKVYRSTKNDGVLRTAKKCYRVVHYRIKNKFRKKNYKLLDKYVDLNNFKNVIVFENNFGWNKIMKQRPQQIAENFGNDTLFIYHSHDDSDYVKCKNRINKIKDNLILIDLGYHRDSLFSNLSLYPVKKFLMVYSTDYIPMDRIELYRKNGYALLYDYVDNIDKELCGDLSDVLLERHNNIISDNSSIIVTTASRLYDNVISINKDANVTLITNGVNYEHFHNIKCDVPNDLKAIKEKYKYIVGYYGALANWFDYKLLIDVALKCPDYAFVLLGIKYDDTYDKSGLNKIDNIFYLGKKAYEQLPSYVSNFDICTIPFLINDITLSTSPVKLFEYMAANKPVITTPLPECKKYSSVFIAKDSKEFINKIEVALKSLKDEKYIKTINKEAKDNSWRNKCEKIEDLMSKHVDRFELMKDKLKERIESGEIDRVIIWRSPFGWNVPLFQRPQHIARALSEKKSLVIYEVSSETDDFDVFDTVNDNLFLIPMSLQLTHDLVMNLVSQYYEIPKYIQIYSTNWSMSGESMKQYIHMGYKILYEYIDELSPELAGTDKLPEFVKEKYEVMLKDKDNVLVVVTANRIEDDLISKRGKKNYCFACNGVDIDHFTDLDNDYELEDSFLKIINNGKINVGYYGALASWFDYKLIKKIAETDKYNIILFGIKYDGSFDKSKIEKCKNVYFLGPKEYKVLPNYASKIDILTIPFVINDITNSTSPLKLFEYMALEKPIVTSAMPECKKYKSVLIANNHDEFISNLEKAYKLKDDKKYLELLLKEANDNSWKKKADDIIALLKKNEIVGKEGEEEYEEN